MRRREWSAEDKERIVAESYAGLDTVSRVAPRNGLLPQQLFTWRREAKKRGAVRPAEPLSLAPVMVAAEAVTGRGGKRRRRDRVVRRAEASPIVIEAGAVVLRIGHGAEVKAVETILRILSDLA